MSVRRKILLNLEGRVTAINEMGTFSGLGLKEAREEMYALLREGLVQVNHMFGMPMYKLTFKGRDVVGRKIGIVK